MRKIYSLIPSFCFLPSLRTNSSLIFNSFLSKGRNRKSLYKAIVRWFAESFIVCHHQDSETWKHWLCHVIRGSRGPRMKTRWTLCTVAIFRDQDIDIVWLVLWLLSQLQLRSDSQGGGVILQLCQLSSPFMVWIWCQYFCLFCPYSGTNFEWKTSYMSLPRLVGISFLKRFFQ